MRKRIIYLITLIIITSLGIIIILNNKNKTQELLDNNNDNFAFFYESDNGKYTKSNEIKWSTGEYILNLENSSCDGEQNPKFLSWNNESNSVILTRNKATKCNLYFDKLTFASYIKSLYKKDGENNLYYHDDDLENGARDYSYRYAGGDYSLTELGREKYQNIYQLIVQTCGGEVQNNNYWCTSGTSFKLAYNDSTYTLIKQAIDVAIKDGYIQKNPVDNYVCFATDQSPCPNENLYRIIGLFKNSDNNYEVKLIKADYIYNDLLGKDGAYRYTVGNSNNYLGNNAQSSYYVYSSNEMNWETSDLNKVNLNTNFLNKIGDYEEKIAIHSWQIAPVTYQYAVSSNAQTAYDYELGNNKTLKTIDAKVGLIYLSDFYYSTPSKYWVYPGQKGVFKGDIPTSQDLRIAIWDNWLWLGNTEWAISVRNTQAYDLDFAGLLASSDYTMKFSVRPVFYLNADVKIAKGNGSLESPYYIF